MGVLMRQKQNENNFILSKVSATSPSKKKKKKVQDWEPFEAVTVTDDITLPITGRILVYKRADEIQTLMMSCN